MAAELLSAYESTIDRITLIPSEGGRFEIDVNGSLVYSKLATGQFPETGEVISLIKKYLQDKQ